jgi:hypothetical protein
MDGRRSTPSGAAPSDRRPDLYKLFKEKKDGCVKVVFHPGG